MMDANAQILFDDLAAAATHLTGVVGVDLYDHTPGAFCLVRGELYELTPCGIRDGFSEMVILEHPVNVQAFKGDEGKPISQLAALLVGKISAFVGDAFVYVGDYLAEFAPLWTAFRCGVAFS